MTDEHMMPQYDGMEYEELVTAAQFLWMENAKLRELLLIAYKAATNPDCNECPNEYSCKNNMLGYCVMWVDLEHRMEYELGIEED